MTTQANHPALNTEITDQPAIYVGTYAKYNSGSIKGQWIDLTEIESKEEFFELCAELHSDEADPEFMFQDWQSIPERFISESHLSEDYFNYADKKKAMSETEAEAFEAYIEAGYNEDNFEEAYQGEWESEEAFATNLVEECYDLEKTMGNLSYYFDYEKFARDLFMSDYTMIGKFVFRADI